MLGTLVSVDPYRYFGREDLTQVALDRAKARVMSQLDKYAGRWRLEVITSLAYWAKCEETFDFIYVDGDHTALGCMLDMVCAWRHLRVGGLMVVDDIEWESIPSWDVPKTALAGFLECLGPHGKEIVHKGFAWGIRKVSV